MRDPVSKKLQNIVDPPKEWYMKLTSENTHTRTHTHTVPRSVPDSCILNWSRLMFKNKLPTQLNLFNCYQLLLLTSCSPFRHRPHFCFHCILFVIRRWAAQRNYNCSASKGTSSFRPISIFFWLLSFWRQEGLIWQPLASSKFKREEINSKLPKQNHTKIEKKVLIQEFFFPAPGRKTNCI